VPKLKTNKSAAKRFKKSKTGKFKRSRAFAGHLSASKDRKRKRNLRKATLVSSGDAPRVSAMLPYS